ncbi:MAG: Mur ligase family protein, partial [Alphaproteobacteria bacterium]|nr:Mur ligase family protein [Alphaproteobacteria bacterium]
MIAPLWTSDTIAARLKAEISGGAWSVTGVSIDSRTIQPGDLFIALKGERHDGHRFVAQALKDGAAAAMVSEKPVDLDENAPLALVSNTDVGLAGLGVLGRDRTAAKVIGITGSVGKTGTKEALASALSRSGRTHASERSFNNHYGVPLTLARLPETAEFAVLEMGMNHAGELSALTDLVRPHVVLITTVAAVHLEFFDSVAGIADAKAEIMQGLVGGGTAILPYDNDHYPRLLNWARE